MTLVLTKAELERMRATIRGPQGDTTAQDRKAQLKQLSNDRMKHWPNTLEALRKKKESFAKEREDQEELKRQEIDRQEAELRRTMRLESIKKANDMLYEQTDKMKMFKSQKLYADVVYERFQQMDHKKTVKDLEKVESMKFHETIVRKVQEGEEIERRKLENQQKAIEQVKVSRYEQREDARLRREEEIRKNREEGLRMKQEAQARLEQEQRDYELKQKLASANNLRMLKANEEIKIVRQEMKEKEQLAELARDAEVEKIEHRKKMLKHLEQVRFEKAQETRQKIIDAAVEQLTKKNNTEQAVLTKQIQEIKDREDKAFADKEERQRQLRQAMMDSRNAQIAQREALGRREFEEESEMVEKWKRENEEAIQREHEKVIRAREETTRIKTIQYNEGKEAARKKQEAKLLEIEQSNFLSSIDNGDDKRFVELCKAEIEKNIRLGKPVYTLLKALDYHQPELLPAKRGKVKKITDEDK